MSQSLIPSSEIDKYRLNDQIIKKTAEQVIKDFAMFGMEINFPDDLNYAYDVLFEQLTFQIARLMNAEPDKLSSLLYQIDIDEKKLKTLKNDAFITHETLSHMILDREFMKVLTRYYFSKNTIPK